MTKVLKWTFLIFWILCVITFIVGQYLAPPNYHLLLGNYWGSLFGSTFIFGIIFFCLAVLFIIVDYSKNRHEKKTQMTQNKFNLSFKRIVSRLFLTGLIGIIFGIAMIPFLTVADGLLFEQRAAIGGQNMIRMVILWGIFTAIVSLYAFWKKHLRMVSVLLILCWFLSISLTVMQGMYSANDYSCKRATGYTLPNEFSRSLDLISERTGVDKTASGTIWQSIFNYRNCLNIQYSDVNDKNVEAYFEYPTIKSINNLQNLKILVNPSYKNFDDLTLAVLLSHEIIHAGQYINEVVMKTKLTCYEKEANAFTGEYSLLLSLNAEEQRLIYARLRENINLNPTFQTFILTGQRGNESTQACLELQKKNNLTDAQMNKCSWEGLESKIIKDIQEDQYYQKQCGIY